jgi:acetolactate synthase-1/2/3 large subunit
LNGFAKKAVIVHIDVDTTSIHKTLAVDIPLVADARQALAAVASEIGAAPVFDRGKRESWLARIEAWNREGPLSYSKEPGGPLLPQEVIELLYKKTGGKAVVTTEVGQHQMWAAQYYLCDRPRQFISSGGLGVMGFGLPAAIGAQVARPGATVVDVAGDGSIMMNIQELATVAQEGLPVKVAILNNGNLGMVRQWQDLFYGGRRAHTILTSVPDFVKLAEAFGIRGFSASTSTEAERIIEEALAHPGPAIMDFKVSPDEMVFPMVPAGKSIDCMLLSPPSALPSEETCPQEDPGPDTRGPEDTAEEPEAEDD